jgi:urease accessory protein
MVGCAQQGRARPVVLARPKAGARLTQLEDPMNASRNTLIFGLSILAASPAAAHVDPVAHGSLAAGFSHPLFGLDHVIAMVAVGLWAAAMGGRAMLALPLAFVGAMVAGFGVALMGVTLPVVEPMILASVIALGVAVALASRVDTRLAVGIVALFGLFHGAAHGGELGGAGALAFGAGFVVATAALHLAGIGLGLGLARSGLALRVAGVATAVAGVVLAIG